MIVIQAYLCTVMFWIVMFIIGRLELKFVNDDTGEQIEADVGIKILYSFGWIITIPLTLLRNMDNKRG